MNNMKYLNLITTVALIFFSVFSFLNGNNEVAWIQLVLAYLYGKEFRDNNKISNNPKFDIHISGEQLRQAINDSYKINNRAE